MSPTAAADASWKTPRILTKFITAWSARDDTRPDPKARAAAGDALTAIDAMVAELAALRARLVREMDLDALVEAEVTCGSDWGSATESQACVLPDGHAEPHQDRSGHIWGDDDRLPTGKVAAAEIADGAPDDESHIAAETRSDTGATVYVREVTGMGIPLAVCSRHIAMDANGRCDACEEVENGAGVATPARPPMYAVPRTYDPAVRVPYSGVFDDASIAAIQSGGAGALDDPDDLGGGWSVRPRLLEAAH